MAADDSDDGSRALRERVQELEQQLDALTTKIEDSSGREWSVSQLVTQFNLTRRQALGVLGLLAAGVSLPGALTRIAAAGTDEAGQIGTANKPQDLWVEDVYDKNGNAVMELPGDGSISIVDADVTGGIVIDETYRHASRYDGGDADARLDNALSAATAGDVIYLEDATYSTNRTISIAVAVCYPGSIADGATVTGTWTIDGSASLSGVRIEGGTIDINSSTVLVENTNNDGSASITAGADRIRIIGMENGSVTFESGTSSCIIDASTNVSTTDNGTNTIGDVA